MCVHVCACVDVHVCVHACMCAGVCVCMIPLKPVTLCPGGTGEPFPG